MRNILGKTLIIKPVVFFFALASLITASLADNSTVKELSIIVFLFLFVVLCHWYFATPKAFFVTTLLIVIFYIGISYWQYDNSVSIGFSDGVIRGEIGTNLYTDIGFYHDESIDLGDNLKISPFSSYIMGDFKQVGYYGPYNLYILWNAMVYLLFGDSSLLWVMIKMTFTILSLFYLFLLARFYVDLPHAILAVVLFSLFPGNILATVTLMRDNIMSLIIILFYYVSIKNKDSKWLFAKLAGLFIVSFIFRGYSVILFLPFVIYVQLKKIHSVQQIVAITVGGTIFVVVAISLLNVEFINQSFVALQTAKDFFASGGSWSSEEFRSSGFNSVIFAAYYFMFGSSPATSAFVLSVTQELLNYLSYIYLNIVLGLSAISLIYIYRRRIIDRGLLLIVCILTPIIYLSLYTYVFGGPVPRIYNLTIWVNVIAIAIFFQRGAKYQKVFAVAGIAIFTIGIYFVKSLIY